MENVPADEANRAIPPRRRNERADVVITLDRLDATEARRQPRC